jgi:thiol-disulfide isomerase/thioredoxin
MYPSADSKAYQPFAKGVSAIIAKPMSVTDGKFAEVFLQAQWAGNGHFWATFCAACRLVALVVNGLATDYAGKAAIVKVNVDENQRMPRSSFLLNPALSTSRFIMGHNYS